ncbi:MAG: hypothetical protein ACKOVH_06885 [Actinomycetota bacterium]
MSTQLRLISNPKHRGRIRATRLDARTRAIGQAGVASARAALAAAHRPAPDTDLRQAS